jgi:hypothetical protein
MVQHLIFRVSHLNASVALCADKGGNFEAWNGKAPTATMLQRGLVSVGAFEPPPEGNSDGTSTRAVDGGNFEAISLNVCGLFWTRPVMPKIAAPTAPVDRLG